MAATYLVTGAAGFIGARFVESCRKRGISVISVDHPDYFESRLEHRGLDFGEIVHREDLFEWLDEKKPKLDAVVHMGACSNTQETDADYLQRVNVEYSQELWNYCRKHQLTFVYASSAATYGEGENGYADDESKMGALLPLNLYGASKLKFDLWALHQDGHKNCPPHWSGFKFFNVYGFGERHKGSMASVVLHGYDQVKQKGSIRLFKSHKEGIADGHQKRDFISVDDVVKVLHFAIEKPISRGIYNLGTGKARTFLDLARAVFAAMGKQEKIDFIDTPESLRDKYQYFTEAQMDKLRAQGYTEPFVSLEDGARAYIKRLSL
jgi:ADP-L-glycero-D-manno-heptose 6-epimerase